MGLGGFGCVSMGLGAFRWVSVGFNSNREPASGLLRPGCTEQISKCTRSYTVSKIKVFLPGGLLWGKGWR